MKPNSSHHECVFPSIKIPLPHIHEQTANAALIMRSFARMAAEECDKFRIEVLESVLAHSKNKESIATYNRTEYVVERSDLMQW
ncbi:hypothetical protein [Buttiauxella ferragutiae]|uniref:hypothetical protein n=1 Tax=Buttiauxella ferragutiae TaxID=82989 RepID=UPI0039FD636F